MRKSKQEFKVGDLVRVARGTSPKRTQHSHDFGVIGTVEEAVDRDGDYVVVAPGRDGCMHTQYVPDYCLKLAKQAMRKRDEYAAMKRRLPR